MIYLILKTDILSVAIQESRIDFEDTRDRKGDHTKVDSTVRKVGVSLYYFIIKNTPSPKESEKRNMQIFYHASLDGNIFTTDSKKTS